MRIVSLIHSSRPRTGGQRFNIHLEDCLSAITGAQVVRYTEPYERYPWFMKPLAPLLELRLLTQLQQGDVLLLGDTTYKYHMLLQKLCKQLKACQSMVMVHHFAYLGEHGIRRRWSEWIQDRYLATADRVLVPSPYTRDIALQKFGDKVAYLPLPFTTTFHPSKDVKRGKLLFVGNIEPRKGLHFLPQVMKSIHKDCHLDIVGSVQDKRYFQQLQQAFDDEGLSNRVRFYGGLERNELELLYTQAEVFVFPSQLEGFGIVLIEAMSYGIPVVAFENSAMPYTIIHQQNGLLASNQNTEEMAQMIDQILDQPNTRLSLQKGMADTIAQLAGEKDLKQATIELYQQLNN